MLISIGKLANLSNVKVATIRYYESIKLMPEPQRNVGNQRRYTAQAVEQLKFIKHARQLGLSLDDIRELIDIKNTDKPGCQPADEIATRHLNKIRDRIRALVSLEKELERIADCQNQGDANECNIIRAIADHELCAEEHTAC